VYELLNPDRIGAAECNPSKGCAAFEHQHSSAAVLLLVMREGLSAFRSSSDRWHVRRSDLRKWMGERETGPIGLGTARAKQRRKGVE
jgi:hypothetical protein